MAAHMTTIMISELSHLMHTLVRLNLHLGGGAEELG